MQRYMEFAPEPRLSSLVVCLWRHAFVGEGPHHHQILPDGCVDIVIMGDSPPEVVGPDTKAALISFETTPELEMHDLLCYLRLLRSPRLPPDLLGPLLQKLRALIARAAVDDPARLSEYGLHPLDVVDGPNSPFLAGREAGVEANLDHLVSTQEPDGSWTPGCSWGDLYPEDWKRARLEWSSIITLDALSTLKLFGRIEGLPAR